MSIRPWLAPVLAVCVAACQAPQAASTAQDAAANAPLLLVAEDLIDVERRALSQGPSITGSLQPERLADLRAEVSAVVLQVLKDNGDPVGKGDLLVRLDPTAIRDQLLSAQEAERAADVALQQAERQLQRWTAMSGKGLVSAENLEAAQTRLNQAQSDLASARARVAEARQQLQKTEVRAPFDGIVGARAVSPGDTAQVGKPLLNVLDPASMRFEGMIAADQVGRVLTGANVEFRVNGYPDRRFTGRVQRVNPIADQATRQVEVLVGIDTVEQALVAGLYAEGRIEVATRSALMVPESVLVRDGDAHFVWQVDNGVLRRLAVRTGEQDARQGDVEIVDGLGESAQLLRHPLGALKEGAKVELATSASNDDAATATASQGN